MNTIDRDANIEVPVGRSRELRLPGYGASGYQWFAVLDDSRVVRLTRVGQPSPPAAPIPAGEGVDDVFVVEALAPGTASIYFDLARAWDRDAVTRRLHVTVTSQPVGA
jgi:hypothetical protein